MSITFGPSGEGECVQMSNANALAIMSVLGMKREYCGIISSADLIGRIDNVSRASIAAATQEPRVDKTPGYATIVSFGRSREYVEMRLQELRDLATKNPGKISWA